MFLHNLRSLTHTAFSFEKTGMRPITLMIIILLMMQPFGRSAMVFAQDPVFSQFYAAPVYLNPGFAGSTGCSRIALNYRQLRSIENLHTINFSFDKYVEALQGGVGLMITSDHPNMYMMRHTISGIYSYHLMVTGDHFVHFAVQAGYVRNDSRWDRFVFEDSGEPPPDNNYKHGLDLAAGVLFFSQKFYGGISAHHLNEPNMSLFNDAQSILPVKYTAHAGLYFERSQTGFGADRGRSYYFSPNIVFQHQGTHSHISGGIYAGAIPLMLGVWYRHWIETPAAVNNTIVFLLGINMGEYRIGYSYDYSLSGFSDVMHATHELSLAFRFNCPQRNIGGRIINYPRF